MQVLIPSVLSAITRFATSNVGLVTVTPAITQLNQIDLGLCVAGQLLLINGQFIMNKGITAGDSNYGMLQGGGTGAIEVSPISSGAQHRIFAQPASSSWPDFVSVVVRVVTSGTILIDTFATSLGSNGTVNIGGSGLAIYRINR